MRTGADSADRIQRVLVEEALAVLLDKKRSPEILDMCTGSGCILLSILMEEDGCHMVLGVDISERALEVAETNRKTSYIWRERALLVESDTVFRSNIFRENSGKNTADGI